MTSVWPENGGWNLAYLPDVYGAMFGGGSVKQAVIQTLDRWLPSYISEINRQLGVPVLSVPKSYLYRADERPIAANTSQITVSVPDIYGQPERRRDGTRTTFIAEVRAFFSGKQDWNESEAIAHAYGMACVGAIAQHPSLGGFAETTVWRGGPKLGASERSATQYRVAALTTFHVVVSNALSPYGGPPAPSVATPDDLPVVLDENVTIKQL